MSVSSEFAEKNLKIKLSLYFARDKKYMQYITCNMCYEQQYQGGLNTKQKLRYMKNHLKLKHPKEWKKTLKEIRELCQKLNSDKNIPSK